MTQDERSALLELAWRHSEVALVRGRTRVGAAVRAASGRLYGGCNLQHRYRSQDLHAEVVAIATALAAGERGIEAIAVVSATSDLPPCGACLDWILQVGGDGCVVVWQSLPGGPHVEHSAGQLLPMHPPYGDD